MKALRVSRGLTQDALAELANLSVDSIRRIERGSFSPTLDTLDKLARGFQLSLPALFAPMDRERSSAATELTDYLAARNDREIRTAFRVLRALFDGASSRRG